jgi:hypothetical protein
VRADGARIDSHRWVLRGVAMRLSTGGTPSGWSSLWQSKSFTTENTENHRDARRVGTGDRSCDRPKFDRFDARQGRTTRRSEEPPCISVVLSDLRGKILPNRSTDSYVRFGNKIVTPISYLCASVFICGFALTDRDTARSATVSFQAKVDGTIDAHRRTQISNYVRTENPSRRRAIRSRAATAEWCHEHPAR